MKNLLVLGLATLGIASPAMAQPNTVFSGLSSSNPPSLALGYDNVASNISCRSKARAKFFELNARDMSAVESNTQWGTVGNLKAVVWCRGDHAVSAVAGYNYSSVEELRDEIRKSF